MIFPNNFEEKIGFDKIRNLLKQKCLSTLGKEKIDEINFSNIFVEIKKNLELTAEYKELHQTEENFPIQYFFDVRETLKQIKIEGNFIEIEELFDLKRSLEEIKAILHFFKNTETDKYPLLKELASETPFYPSVIESISRILTKEGKIKDNASKELAEIRKSLISKSSGASRIMHKVLQNAKQNNIIESETNLTIRNGKMLIPVSANNKRKIKGFIVDESATGKTSFIEPFEIIELNNEIKELEFAERREILKILLNISKEIRPYADDLLISYDFLSVIDFLRAKALFAIQIEANIPKLSNSNQILLKSAKHPLLYLSFLKDNRQVIPLDIELSENQRIILISGPNAGGKSVCLKTVGLLQYMHQCGLLIPVNENSKLGIFSSIFIDIGDEQSIEDDLSTYSSHLNNMKNFLKNTDSKSLVLIDEFGSGTEPALGGAIAESILEELVEIKTFGVITTHYGNLKHFATLSKHITNGAMLFDTKKMKALYELEIGRPGSSFAFEIAKNIGLPQTILDKAEKKLGKDHIDFDKLLKEIDSERRSLNNLNKRLSQKEKHLEESLKKYENETELTLKKRKEIISEAKQNADKILSDINKTVEKTIFEIKKSNAEKEKTKESRKKIEEIKDKTQKRLENESNFLSAKVKKIKNKAKVKQEEQSDNQTIKEKINIGDKVKFNDSDSIAEVLEIKDQKLLLSLGNMQMYIESSKVTKISNKQFKNLSTNKPNTNEFSGWDVSKVKNTFSHSVDIRGKRADEAMQIISKYIDQAIMVAAHEVKILHGKGNGTLRLIIREYLSTIDIVKSYQDEKVEFGGSGITVVQFAY
ncbi:MAG: Smr/MutS family protein [Bacteroidales bacterium]|nr:Smr/MutS family protein [Bacteroidales bacterium]MBN2758154.1 Smr/MutS family protein [Bacteroidales bacterium]